jgi:hypothetical protein
MGVGGGGAKLYEKGFLTMYYRKTTLRFHWWGNLIFPWMPIVYDRSQLVSLGAKNPKESLYANSSRETRVMW